MAVAKIKIEFLGVTREIDFDYSYNPGSPKTLYDPGEAEGYELDGMDDLEAEILDILEDYRKSCLICED